MSRSSPPLSLISGHYVRSHALGEIRRADGEYRWILDNGVPRTDSDGAFVGYIGSCIDIHGLKQVELGLKQTMQSRNEAFDALDRVAAMMAHEFKNVLMGIQLFHAAIRPAVNDPVAVLDLLGQAEAAVAEGTTIVKGLLAAAQHHPEKLEAIHVNEFIHQSRAILRGAAGEAATLIEDLTADPDEVVVDPPQFLAALLNLVSNSREAMSEGGTITIRTNNMTVRPETLDEPDLLPGRYIVVAVSDTGEGMDEGALEHAFEPFFTTKDEGTGIDLSRVRAFARKAGGIGRITSVAGKGTTVRLYLPENAKRAR